MVKKKAYKNLFFGLLNKISVILLGLLIPKVILLYFGSNINGMLSTVNQIYGCITILEAGIGYATIQALYRPIALGDKERINGILSATHFYYRRIGLIYLGMIFILTYIFPFIGHSDISTAETRMIVFLTGIAGVITFFFHGKFLLYLEAEGKSYISYNVTAISTLITQLLKIVLIVHGFRITVVQFVVAIIQLAIMEFYYLLRRKKYSWINFNEYPIYEAIAKKNNVFFHRVCFFVFSNTDILLVSLFLNYKLASVYAIYSLLASTVYSLVGQVCTSTTFYWGQRYENDEESFGIEHILFQKSYYVIVFAANCILYVMTLPFISLYTKGVNDISYINQKLNILFVVVYTLQALRVPLIVLTELTGKFKETQGQAILESIMNIGISILLVQVLGIYGILLGTIISILFRNILLIKYVLNEILHQKSYCIYACWMKNLFISILAVTICKSFMVAGSNWIWLIATGIVVAFSVALIFIAGNLQVLKEGMKIMKKID